MGVVVAVLLAFMQVSVPASPSPAPSGSPDLTYNGHVRAFYFTRQNCSGYSSSPCVPDASAPIPGTYKELNQAAFNAAILLHGEYRFPQPHLSAAATYVYANALGINGPCDIPAEYGAGGACMQYPSENNNYHSSDTTLPGFILSTLAEAYLRYSDDRLKVTAGDQMFDAPWAGPSDSRIKAAYYEGVDAQYDFARRWKVQVSRMIQWESRTSSEFNKSNLIVPAASDGTTVSPTTGFLLVGASYSDRPNFTATAQYYDFYDVATLTWLTAKWSFGNNPAFKPYAAFQYANENNAGASLVGSVRSDVWGVLGGAKFGDDLDVSVAYDSSPWRSAIVALPSGVTCKNGVISGKAPTGGTGYWLPSGGTPNCTNGANGQTTIYYGGIASPYSDSYSSSPLFTTTESQDIVERRSAGTSLTFALTLWTAGRHVRAILTKSLDEFTNAAGAETTSGTGVDVEYYFKQVTNAPYRGISVRERWKQRTQTYTEAFGGTPLFNYNRVELEYDF